MRTFKIYRHPARGLEAVKIGFSWPAFFFGGGWMLAKRLWRIFAILLAAHFALMIFEKAIDASRSSPGELALAYLMLLGGSFTVWLVPAFKGNSWRVSNLVSRGYEFVAEVRAETPESAAAMLASPNARLSA